jgi:hypothetical protein
MYRSTKPLVSDVVVIGASRSGGIDGVRTHFVSAWSALQSMLVLSQLLRGIELELIENSDLSRRESSFAANWAPTTDIESPVASEDGDDREA